MFQSPPTTSLPQHMEIVGAIIQDEIGNPYPLIIGFGLGLGNFGESLMMRVFFWIKCCQEASQSYLEGVRSAQVKVQLKRKQWPLLLAGRG